MKIGFIGAGKVGFSLGKYFTEKGINLSGYYSREPASSKDAAEFTSSSHYLVVSDLIRDSDVIFLTVPDAEISRVYNEIKTMNIIGKQLCHCSGAMTVADAFPDISAYSAQGFSIHPLFPVSSRYESYKQLDDAFFCIEGDNTGIANWTEIFAGLGNRTRIISPENKKQYHAACAMSSNLVCGLISISVSLLRNCGFSDEEALCALKPLAESNIRNIFSQGISNALTGAVERCDIKTVENHIRYIDSDEDRQIYKSLSLKLIQLAEIRHPEIDYSGMYQILR